MPTGFGGRLRGKGPNPRKRTRDLAAQPTRYQPTFPVNDLERDWPSHQIWTVPTWDGHKRATIWCARRWDWQPGDQVINAESAERLVEYLEEEAEQ